ncbi:hypothetical protein VTK73DRAFT_10220 [Phialemonium thermophilum]|uniref:Uncharacterized protein n=1 Tax=Phialemonium thermophilum TaxID=223376 RepID=A0ABR3VXS2_9PEZI
MLDAAHPRNRKHSFALLSSLILHLWLVLRRWACYFGPSHNQTFSINTYPEWESITKKDCTISDKRDWIPCDGQRLVDPPQHVHVRAGRRAVARHDPLGAHLAAPAEPLDRLVDHVDHVLPAHLELHRAARAARALDAERARPERQDLAVTRDAVRELGRRVALDVADDLQAVDSPQRSMPGGMSHG